MSPKEIPPPMTLGQVSGQPSTYKPGMPDYSVPFMIAESCRMMLVFLANDSRLPNAHRNVIAEFVLGHNNVLSEYITAHYGNDGAHHANMIAQAMRAQFLQRIADDRNTNEAQLFENLEREMESEMGDGGVPD